VDHPDGVRAVLDEQQISLRRVLELKEGDTLFLNATPDSLVELRAGALSLTRGRMGRRNHNIAVRVEAPVAPAARQALTSLS
jgi:flagellar motor switch protein FliM